MHPIDQFHFIARVGLATLGIFYFWQFGWTAFYYIKDCVLQ